MTESNLPEAKRVVKWNVDNPINTLCDWYNSTGEIETLRVKTLYSAYLDANGRGVVQCSLVGMPNCAAKIYLTQLKPIKEGK